MAGEVLVGEFLLDRHNAGWSWVLFRAPTESAINKTLTVILMRPHVALVLLDAGEGRDEFPSCLHLKVMSSAANFRNVAEEMIGGL